MDILTKMDHFMVVKTTDKENYIGHFFIKEIVRLHGIIKLNVPNIDAKFTFMFWKSMFQELGI